MEKRRSLYREYPDHRVDLESNAAHLRVEFNGVVVADSRDTLTVRESNHDPVAYFPIRDVRTEHLDRTGHQTFCPFKGEASYWSVRVGDQLAQDAIWGYEDPFEEVAGLRGHVAFYREPFDWSEGD